MNAVFFSSSRPLPPLPQPSVNVACATTNNSITLSLPSLYNSYTWSSGQKTQTITVNQPGVYRAVLKDKVGNTYLSPALDVQGPIQPATPTISLSSRPGTVVANQLQVCADSSLSLLANTSANSTGVWSVSTTTTVSKAINLNQSGTYSVQAVNVYGCKSAQPATITLSVRPKVPVPSIEQIGAYSLQAVLPTQQAANLTYSTGAGEQK